MESYFVVTGTVDGVEVVGHFEVSKYESKEEAVKRYKEIYDDGMSEVRVYDVSEEFGDY